MRRFATFLTLFILSNGSLKAYSQSAELSTIETIQKPSIHGLLDVSIKNDYITPRGLLVSNTGVTFQVLSLLFFDLYDHPDCFVRKATITLGVWNDIWTEQNNSYVGAWNELDWIGGLTFELAGNWSFGVQFLGFLSPPHAFRGEDNLEFLLSYNDEEWDFPVVFNPYAKLFWTMAGDSTVVTGKPGGTFDVELGLLPTYTADYFTLLTPTWITVGPSAFWSGSDLALPNKKSNWGVFSTGLRIDIPFEFNPGKWTWYLGGQYYHLINDNLLQAQTYTLDISYNKTHRDVGVAYSGLIVKF